MIGEYDLAHYECEIKDLKRKLEEANKENVRLTAKCGALLAQNECLAKAAKELAFAASFKIPE